MGIHGSGRRDSRRRLASITRRAARSRHRLLGPALLWVIAVGCRRQSAPGGDARSFEVWARRHAAPIASVEPGHALDDLEPLREIVGDARVVAVGESLHDVHEFLALKHRTFEYMVMELGFTALAMETGLPESRLVYDYVLGAATDPTLLRRAGFTWGFGEWRETWTLIKWMRSYNQDPAHDRKIRFYGIDLTGGRDDTFTDARPAIDGTLGYLRGVDSAYARSVARTLLPLTELATYQAFPVLRAETRSAYATAVGALVDRFELQRVVYLSRTSDVEFQWAHRHAIAARQLVTSFWAIPVGGAGPGDLPEGAELEYSSRDRAMADNVGWVLEREGPGGTGRRLRTQRPRATGPAEGIGRSPLPHPTDRDGTVSRRNAG